MPKPGTLLSGMTLFAALACAPQNPAPAAPAAEGRGDLLLVANKQADNVSVIDPASGETVATLPTGVGPHEVAVSGDGRWAVATDYGRETPGNTLTVIDLDRMEVARTIDLGVYRRPHGIAFLPGDRQLAVTSEANQAVVLLDWPSGTVAGAIPTGQRGSHMLAVSPDGRRIYTANIPDGSVSELDVANRATLRTFPVAPVSEGIALAPDGQLWVGSNQNRTVTVLDTRSGTPLDTLQSPGVPYRVNLSPDGRLAVVSNPMTSQVQLWDTQTRTLRQTVTIPLDPAKAKPDAEGSAGPVGAVVSPDGRTAYVALQGTDEVAVVSLPDGTIRGYLSTGSGPDGIAVARRR